MGSPHSVHTTLDLLVLTVLARRGPLHGYAIASAIQALSVDALRIDEGSLYPALHRMEEAGWVGAQSVVTENKRRARVYRITRAGRRQAAVECERWNSLAAGVGRVLRHA